MDMILCQQFCSPAAEYIMCVMGIHGLTQFLEIIWNPVTLALLVWVPQVVNYYVSLIVRLVQIAFLYVTNFVIKGEF